MSRQWFILQVGTNREEKVRRSLVTRVQANGLAEVISNVLVLTEKRAEVKNGQRRTVERRVYPGYVMVEIDTQEDGSIPPPVWHLVRETLGPLQFVGALDRPDKPLPMTADEVAKMRRQLDLLAQPEVSITVDFEKGDAVRVKEGSFEGFEGVVEEVLPEKGLVRVALLVFGRPTPIDFEYWKVSKAGA